MSATVRILRPLASLRPDDEAPLDPIAIVLWLGLVGLFGGGLVLAGVPLRLAEPLTAAAFVLVCLGLIVRSTANGIMLLFLLPPFFNGDNHLPYFFMLELVLVLTLVRGFAGHLLRGRPLVFPAAPVFVLFLLSTVISLPLDLKGLGLEVQVSPWMDILETIRLGGVTGRLAYVRAVLNVASGIAVYVLVVNSRWSRPLLVRLAVAVTVLYGVVTLVGLFWLTIFPARLFLTLHLNGWVMGAFSGVGFNQSYFAQYALAYLPLVVWVLAERAPAWAKGLAAGAVLASAYTILTTYQRGAYIVLGVELVLLAMVVLGPGGRRSLPWSEFRALWATGGLAVVAIGLLVLTPVGSRAYEKMLMLWRWGDPYREHVIPVAWRMFLDQPLLGIGSGRYADMFPFFSSRSAEFQWGSLSSHSIYAQFLAEQGALGLLSFFAILGLTLGPAARAAWRGAAPLATSFFLVSLGAWLTYGWLQYTFLMRAMQLYFWIAVGFVVALSPPPARSPKLGRRGLALGLVLLAATAAVRLHTVLIRPVPPVWGFHDWQPDNVRWTQGGAWATLPVEGRVLRLTFAGPDPRITGRPQEVLAVLDGMAVARISIEPSTWKTIDIPVDKPIGATVLLQLRPSYTFVPAALGLNDDTRRLGILLKPMVWLPRESGGPTAPSE